MSRTYDFAAIKQQISITEGAMYLGLKFTESGDSLRCKCPVCEDAGNRSLSILPEKNYFRCFHADKGGSVIDLVSHIQGVDVRQAAKWLLEAKEASKEEVPDEEPLEEEPKLKIATTPRSQEEILAHINQLYANLSTELDSVLDTLRKGTQTMHNLPAPGDLPVLGQLPTLISEHEAIQEMGLSPEMAYRLGIGYSPRGIMRGLIAFPLIQKGYVVGYIGIPPGTGVRLPKNLKS